MSHTSGRKSPTFGRTRATVGVPPAPAAAEPAGRLRRGWRRVLRRPASVVGGVIVLVFVVLAIGAPWIARTDPVKADWSQIRKAPSGAHPFGTDDLGRDNFARVVWGSRISMQAGSLSILLPNTGRRALLPAPRYEPRSPDRGSVAAASPRLSLPFP